MFLYFGGFLVTGCFVSMTSLNRTDLSRRPRRTLLSPHLCVRLQFVAAQSPTLDTCPILAEETI